MRFFLALLFLLTSFSFVQAKTLLVSDIDDTIKIAHVLDFDGAAIYSFDENSRFLGMSELFALLKNDNPDMDIYYLSRAPAWWMQNTHLNFLKNGKFPAGIYIPRTKYSLDEHKLLSLREIMAKVNPDKVIFFGDNGEKDREVYEQIKNEYASRGVRFVQFIRLAYSTQGPEEFGVLPYADQTGFVTPIEVSLELNKEGLLSEESLRWSLENIASAILKQKSDYDTGVVAFPTFMRCNDFVWKWEEVAGYPQLPAVKQRILQRCQKK